VIPVEGQGDDLRYWRRNWRVRRARRRRTLVRWTAIAGLHVVVVTALVAVGARAIAHVAHSPRFEVADVDIAGIDRADPRALYESVREFEGRSVLDLDLDEIAARLESDPWVAEATVRRSIPGRLTISIRERRAAALARLDGRICLVADDGSVIGPSGPSRDDDLPVIIGLDGFDGATLERAIAAGVDVVTRLANVRPGFLPHVSEIDVSSPDRVRIVTIEPGADILLDPDRVERNLDDYMALRPQIAARIGSLEYVDLRWDRRITLMPVAAGGSRN